MEKREEAQKETQETPAETTPVEEEKKAGESQMQAKEELKSGGVKDNLMHLLN